MDENNINQVLPGLITININKNSNMKKNITEILQTLQENNHQVLITSKSLGLSKLLSIVEISKQQFQQLDQNGLFQYNKMTSIEQDKVLPKHEETEEEIIKRELHSTREKVPVLSIILSKNQQDLPGWTAQLK